MFAIDLFIIIGLIYILLKKFSSFNTKQIYKIVFVNILVLSITKIFLFVSIFGHKKAGDPIPNAYNLIGGSDFLTYQERDLYPSLVSNYTLFIPIWYPYLIYKIKERKNNQPHFKMVNFIDFAEQECYVKGSYSKCSEYVRKIIKMLSFNASNHKYIIKTNNYFKSLEFHNSAFQCENLSSTMLTVDMLDQVKLKSLISKSQLILMYREKFLKSLKNCDFFSHIFFEETFRSIEVMEIESIFKNKCFYDPKKSSCGFLIDVFIRKSNRDRKYRRIKQMIDLYCSKPPKKDFRVCMKYNGQLK